MHWNSEYNKKLLYYTEDCEIDFHDFSKTLFIYFYFIYLFLQIDPGLEIAV